MDGQFYNPHAGELTFDEVVRTIVEGMKEDSKARYEILVGTDSSSAYTHDDFVSAIVLHKIGKGGRYFWTRRKERKGALAAAEDMARGVAVIRACPTPVGAPLGLFSSSLQPGDPRRYRGERTNQGDDRRGGWNDHR